MTNELSGGHLVVECLRAQGVDRIFCVPGESYLDVLDGLHDADIDVVVSRHEGAAAMMADADGKMTGRPGVCLVTRGPGATNASAGIHVAAQDSTPLVMLVGQIGREMRGREAFQEVDYRAFFGGMAKWVEEIDRAERIPEIMSHAFHIAQSGRPGPVVLALPEDMLRDHTTAIPGPRVRIAEPAPDPRDIGQLGELLAGAKRPFVMLGGTRWDEAALADIQTFAEKWHLPVGCTFRRQGLFDALHPNYAGDVGLGINPALKARVAEADVVLMIGARFSENPSQGFSLFDIPHPAQTLVHVHPGPEELGRIYTPALPINATPGAFLRAALALEPKPNWPGQADEAHRTYLDWSDTPPPTAGAVTMAHTVTHMREVLPRDAVFTNGAGNYSTWMHRFYRYGLGCQLAPTSGSMGYGMPAAVASALRQPEREVFCFAGDGCFQMTGMEFGVAAEHGLKVRVLVCDNAIYGTIRMHQIRNYPGRPVATDMKNPDFAAWARAYGAVGVTVERDADFAAALAEARAAEGPALVHLKLDARDIGPGNVAG